MPCLRRRRKRRQIAGVAFPAVNQQDSGACACTPRRHLAFGRIDRKVLGAGHELRLRLP